MTPSPKATPFHSAFQISYPADQIDSLENTAPGCWKLISDEKLHKWPVNTDNGKLAVITTTDRSPNKLVRHHCPRNPVKMGYHVLER